MRGGFSGCYAILFGSVPALSRVNPLLQGPHRPRRSGFTREEASTGKPTPTDRHPPVGAGSPAKRPAQATHPHRPHRP
ncbi:hypothetical protein FGL97_25410 [Pseudomonas putida]|nr:hypothetical protein [Pseudomonas putida]NVN71381.1 hypothetical protein [Pseudomonas putida]